MIHVYLENNYFRDTRIQKIFFWFKLVSGTARAYFMVLFFPLSWYVGLVKFSTLAYQEELVFSVA